MLFEISYKMLLRLCNSCHSLGVPKEFARQLFDGDVARLHVHLEKAAQMVPCLTDAPIRCVISGPITYSPEAVPLLGPMQGFRNYWVMAGFGYSSSIFFLSLARFLFLSSLASKFPLLLPPSFQTFSFFCILFYYKYISKIYTFT